ncbi:MAG: hypothetical protein QM800_12705 [Paludibacter sp.]
MYESYFDKYNASYKGKAVISLKSYTGVYANYPGYGEYYQTDKTNVRVGFLTGYWTTENGVNWAQVEFENDIFSEYTNSYIHFGYIDMAQYRIYTFGQKSGVGSMIDQLINNNKAIYENNLLCAAVLKIKGGNVDQEQKKVLYALQTRLNARNEKIAGSTFLESKRTATPTTFNKYTTDLQEFMNNPGIGIAPVVAAIVVYVVVPVLLSAIIYLIFRETHKESTNNVVYSKKLTNVLLSKLTPEEYEQLLAENQENADRIKKAASGGSLIATAKYLAIGYLGFRVIDNFLQSRRK